MNILKKLPFYRRYSTKKLSLWWKERKIDWKVQYLDTWDIPRRRVLTSFLASFQWISLIEVGVGGGANLYSIVKHLKGRQVGGIDVNPEAIELAKKTFIGGVFHVCPADDIMMSDKSADVILSDMMYIYVAPKDIERHVRELKRVARNNVVLHEFHSTSWWQRFKLRLFTGHCAHDWKTILQDNDFYDIMIYKLPNDFYEDDTHKQFSHLIKATAPKR